MSNTISLFIGILHLTLNISIHISKVAFLSIGQKNRRHPEVGIKTAHIVKAL